MRPALVGIDSLNIDRTHTGRRPAHSWLLAARIPIVEHLTGAGAAAGHRVPVHRRTAGGRGDGDVPGTGVRDRGLTGAD